MTLLQISSLCEDSTDDLSAKNLIASEFDIIKAFSLDVENNRFCENFPGDEDHKNKLVCSMDFSNSTHNLEEVCGLFGGKIRFHYLDR
jgi:hypothetical protein